MRFQFQYGAIKRKQSGLLQLLKNHFNSNMVRLREKGITIDISINEFQFQYGAIKSKKDEPINDSVNTFQFQYGAIKSMENFPR